MQPISNNIRPTSYFETQSGDGDFTTDIERQEYNKELVLRANTVPISLIFKHYGLRLDEYNRKICCPFKSHKNGRETTPSFVYYHETNSYCCFGCRIGSRPVDFVAEMDSINRISAAHKIVDQFSAEIDEDLVLEGDNVSERLQILVNFSTRVLDFRRDNITDHAFQFIEYICWVFDRGNIKNKLDNEALQRLVEHCIDFIEAYDPELILSFEDDYNK
jgi:hypothetical protein